MKRTLDLVIAIGALPLCAIAVIAVCAIAIRLTSPGAAILRQQRVGRYEQLFTCFKLRDDAYQYAAGADARG